MYSNISIDNYSVYEKVSVSRSMTTNYRQAVENHSLRALPYSLSIDRSSKIDYVVRCINDRPVWVYDYSTGTFSQSRNVDTTYTHDFMSDGTTSFEFLKSKVDSCISDYSNKRDNRLLAKIKTQSLPLIMAWKERHKTGELFLHVANNIAQACKAIRRPKQFIRSLYKGFKRKSSTKAMERRAQKAYISFLKYRKWPKGRSPHVGDLFLQYEFAWKPLIMDIQNAIDATTQTEKRLHGSSVRVSYNYSDSIQIPGGRMTGDELLLKCDFKVFGHQKLFWSLDSVALASLSQIQSLPSTLWDAVPYSFVIDWFVDVGKWLELKDATLGLSFNNGYKSMNVERRYTSSINGPRPGSSCVYIAQNNWPERYQFSFQRQILSSFPDPHLETSFEIPSSIIHMAEGAALVSQALRQKL